jgi:hemerythrin-like domain-containing protein
MMMNAIETLMNEHRLIEQVLGSLETFAINLRNGADGDRGTVKDYADFLSNFADKCHHGKEEDRLFVAMSAHGFPKDFGPVAVMLADHLEGRGHVQTLREIGSGSGPLTGEERDAVVAHSQSYVALLRAHIMKEDNILYPMAIQAIPSEEMAALASSFDDFEQRVMGHGKHERFRSLAQSLVAAYPPDPERMQAGGACSGCSGHM